MSGWDVLNNVLGGFPQMLTALILVAAMVALFIFIFGFSKHGMDFLKHGLKPIGYTDIAAKIDGLDAKINEMGDRLDAKINGLDAKIDRVSENLDAKINMMGENLDAKINEMGENLDAKIDNIQTNHFGHLKKYLTVLNGILLDKNVIDNESKARLDNELQGM
ncbi:hypothetical protein FACS1894102_0110 [Spirochaetia bacterium]|nr:hypothetical protein FACS1894102_0110 [Spirochaetia bacterium]